MNVNLNTRKVEPLSARPAPAPAPTPTGKSHATNFNELLKNAKTSSGNEAGAAAQASPPAAPATGL